MPISKYAISSCLIPLDDLSLLFAIPKINYFQFPFIDAESLSSLVGTDDLNKRNGSIIRRESTRKEERKKSNSIGNVIESALMTRDKVHENGGESGESGDQEESAEKERIHSRTVTVCILRFAYSETLSSE